MTEILFSLHHCMREQKQFLKKLKYFEVFLHVDEIRIANYRPFAGSQSRGTKTPCW